MTEPESCNFAAKKKERQKIFGKYGKSNGDEQDGTC